MKKIGSGEYGLLVTYVGGRHEEKWFESSDLRRKAEHQMSKDFSILVASTIGKSD